MSYGKKVADFDNELSANGGEPMIGTRLIVLMTLFFTTLLTSLAFAGSVNLPRTGQQTCYD